jgi:hypothetical protein
MRVVSMNPIQNNRFCGVQYRFCHPHGSVPEPHVLRRQFLGYWKYAVAEGFGIGGPWARLAAVRSSRDRASNVAT